MSAGISALEIVFINIIDDINKTGYILNAFTLFSLLIIKSS